ncbi:MAG TPA: MFS transporter [Paludibaculum sp.]
MGRGIGTGPFWWIIAATLTGMLGFGAVIPVLPPYLHDQLHASTVTTGFVVGVASAFALLGRLFAGPLADRRGRRITLMLGLALCGLSGLMYQPMFGVWSLTAARILHGAGEGFFLTAAVAWVVDLAAAHQRGQALGFLASGVWGGLSLGPLVGQMLGGLPQVAWFVTVASFLALAAAWRYAHEEPRVRTGGKTLLFPRAVAVPGVVLGLANVPYATMAGFLPLLLRERGMVGLPAFAAFAGCVLCTRTAFGSLPDRLGPKRTLFGGIAVLIVGMALVATTHNRAVMLLAAALVGIGYSFPWPSLAVIVVEKVSEGERASALGALTACFDLFVALGAVAAGLLAGWAGLTAVFWMGLCSAALAAVVARVARVE